MLHCVSEMCVCVCVCVCDWGGGGGGVQELSCIDSSVKDSPLSHCRQHTVGKVLPVSYSDVELQLGDFYWCGKQAKTSSHGLFSEFPECLKFSRSADSKRTGVKGKTQNTLCLRHETWMKVCI